MTPAPLSIADVLDAAADLIEPEGAWTQGAFSKTKGGRYNGDLVAPRKPACWCVLGAIARVSDSDPTRPFEGIARDAMLALDCVASGDVPGWNDAPERTQSEVLATLREAAALAREAQA